MSKSNDDSKRPGPEPDYHDPRVQASLKRYWRSNIRFTLFLLAIWAVAGLGGGILFADWLNQYRLFNTGYPLGFWMAQQGSIITFVLLILAYCIFMNRLDARHHRELGAIEPAGPGEDPS